MPTRSIPLICSLAALLGGCEARPAGNDGPVAAEAAPAGAATLEPSIAATHEWSVKHDGAPFAVAMLGSSPSGYADMLMGTLPTALFKATGSCVQKAPPGPNLLLRVEVAAGAPAQIRTAPEGPFPGCIAKELGSASLPPAPGGRASFEVTLAQKAPPRPGQPG